MSPPEVFAAGGIVTRTETDGVKVLLVHRPRYDDWTFPKGKRDPGETDEDTARREVWEETGLRCRLGPEVGTTEYVDSRARSKQVRYWLMVAEPTATAFEPNAEVDELRWLNVDDAADALTYDHDRRLLRDLGPRLDSAAGDPIDGIRADAEGG